MAPISGQAADVARCASATPSSPVASFVTGGTLAASAMRFLKEAGLPWLQKPFTPEQVLALVARIETA